MEQSSRQMKRPEIRQPGAMDLRQKGEEQIETSKYMVVPFSGHQKSRVLKCNRIQKPG